MFNPLRLLRRKDHIDDAATAYIEGRATDTEMGALQERAGREPGLMVELDSLRQTVSLLKSVEPAKAPRSFALSHAPVQVRARRHLALAPAVLAIVAAAGVGLLAVGNLAEVVRQSGDSQNISFTSNRGSSEDSVAMIESATGPEGNPGLTEGPAGAQGPSGTTTEPDFHQGSSTSALADATPTVVASFPLSTPAPQATTVSDAGMSELAPPRLSQI